MFGIQGHAGNQDGVGFQDGIGNQEGAGSQGGVGNQDGLGVHGRARNQDGAGYLDGIGRMPEWYCLLGLGMGMGIRMVFGSLRSLELRGVLGTSDVMRITVLWRISVLLRTLMVVGKLGIRLVLGVGVGNQCW